MQVTASAVDKSGAPPTRVAVLADRAVIGVTGPDAEHFLQGILTQDMHRLSAEPAVYAGLLSPQGKILFDFFVARAPDGFLIEVAADKAGDLVKRLGMYRLRAKVQLTDHSADMRVLVVWGSGPASHGPMQGTVAFADPRLGELGSRILAPAAHADDIARANSGMEATAADWHAHRISLGVPEGGKDFAYGDAFPHEADMDQLAGVAFDKGCYVGQEVVSRMQHRGTARKRSVIVKGDGEIVPGAGITAGGAQIGSVGSSAGRTALALVRLDRAAEAAARGVPLMAGEIAVGIVKPDWARFEMVPRKVVDEGP